MLAIFLIIQVKTLGGEVFSVAMQVTRNNFYCFQALDKVHNIMKDVFLIFPNYCLGRGLMDIAFNQYKNEFYFKTGKFIQYDKFLILCKVATDGCSLENQNVLSALM